MQDIIQMLHNLSCRCRFCSDWCTALAIKAVSPYQRTNMRAVYMNKEINEMSYFWQSTIKWAKKSWQDICWPGSKKKIKWTATSYPYAPNRSQLYGKNLKHMDWSRHIKLESLLSYQTATARWEASTTIVKRKNS